MPRHVARTVFGCVSGSLVEVDLRKVDLHLRRFADQVGENIERDMRDDLDDLEERSFRYFWDLSHDETGLTPDRWPTKSFASVAATGFALTAYPIGVERGYVSREAARERVQRTLEFLWSAPQDSAASGATGFHGFFYHFLDNCADVASHHLGTSARGEIRR